MHVVTLLKVPYNKKYYYYHMHPGRQILPSNTAGRHSDEERCARDWLTWPVATTDHNIFILQLVTTHFIVRLEFRLNPTTTSVKWWSHKVTYSTCEISNLCNDAHIVIYVTHQATGRGWWIITYIRRRRASDRQVINCEHHYTVMWFFICSM